MMKAKYSSQKGAVLLIMTILFTAVSITILFGTVTPLVRQLQMSRDLYTSKISYFAAEAGSEDAFYRLTNSMNISFPLSLSFNNSAVTINLADLGNGEQEITSQGVFNNNYRTVIKDITSSNSLLFSYALESGNGGIEMQNNSSVSGNVYASGQLTGNSNTLSGTAVSAGVSGLIRGVHVTLDGFAHSIQNSTIDRNAYYASLSNTTVGGTKFANSSDQPLRDMPVPDEMIEQWESDAALGENISSPCPYNISTDVTLGPAVINCDVSISGNDTDVTIAGAIWIKGNLTIQNQVKVRVDDSIGNRSVPIIVDNPGNLSSSSRITLANTTEYYGSTGSTASYIFLVSQNNSAENGGSTVAIDVQNGAIGNILVYAPHGLIKLSNNVALKSVVAYKILLTNNSQAIYNINLNQPLYISGSSGTWKIKKWEEI
jgi:hypothetical protein